MTKSALLSSLKRCYLDLKGVDEYYIRWTVEKNKLNFLSAVTAFKTTTMCSIIIPGIEIKDLNVFVRNPKVLLNLLSIAEEELTLKFDKKFDYKLTIKDKSFEQDFILCDPTTVRVESPVVDEPLSYDMVIELTADFIDKYLKAKKANGSETITVEIKDRKATFELGDTYSNKTRFLVEEDGMFDMKKLAFSSDMIEEVLQRNKGCTGRMFIHGEGLMKIYFTEEIGIYKPEATYFLIALDQL